MPYHTHEYFAETTYDFDHNHGYKGITGEAHQHTNIMQDMTSIY